MCRRAASIIVSLRCAGMHGSCWAALALLVRLLCAVEGSAWLHCFPHRAARTLGHSDFGMAESRLCAFVCALPTQLRAPKGLNSCARFAAHPRCKKRAEAIQTCWQMSCI